MCELMKNKTLIAVILFSVVAINGFAQPRTEPFLLSLPENKTEGSLYSAIGVVDIRKDTSGMGIVQKGAFNKQAKVVAEIPLQQQLSNILAAFNNGNTGNGELLLLLRELYFAEVTKAMSEFGYCHFRAVLFAKTAEGYRKLETIDTVAVIRAMDVTKKMFREGSKAITGFISRNLTKQPDTDIVVAQHELTAIDSFEKQQIPVYTATAYTDGLYYTWQSFAQQQPDETGLKVWVDKKDRFKGLSYKNKKGQDVEIKNQFFYAFVHHGKPYVSGEFTCYPLEKRGDDFYFTGKANDAKNTDVAAASFFFGIMGGLMASSATSVFEMKIDHLTGGFKRVKEIDK